MTTPSLLLPELTQSQAQPHVTVNGALRKLDALVQLSVISRVVATPPISPGPLDGDRYIVPAGATGSWAGHVGEVAFYSGTAWEFVGALDGWTAWVADERRFVKFSDGSPFGWSTGLVSSIRTFGAAWSNSSALVPASTTEVRVYCPVGGTIRRVTILGDGAAGGTCTIDIRSSTLAALPTVSGDSICSGVEPQITSGLYMTDATLAGWTTDIVAGTVLVFVLQASTIFKSISIQLSVEEAL